MKRYQFNNPHSQRFADNKSSRFGKIYSQIRYIERPLKQVFAKLEDSILPTVKELEDTALRGDENAKIILNKGVPLKERLCALRDYRQIETS